jgi:hypothetical protein
VSSASSAHATQFDPTLFALNVIVKIPLPTNTALVTPSVLTGKTKCVRDSGGVVLLLLMIIMLAISMMVTITITVTK